MKLARMYAEALAAARTSNKSHSELLAGLKSALVRRGHGALLPHIFSEYEKITAATGAGTSVVVAHEKDRAAAMKELSRIEPNSKADVRVDHSLISGFIIQGRDFRFDASARRTLINLYQSLVQ